MTSTAAADPAREALAAPALRRSLAAMIRRRVPVSDVEDVAQTILCDALAAPTLPSDPEDLRRFVAGIARHKVADFHRSARRRMEAPESCHDEDPSPGAAARAGSAGPTVPPAPLEARALLSRIASSLATSDREQQTLEWLVREHGGEQLLAIARDEGLPAPAVRQRVSRLRRVLRAQWAHALVLLLVFGASVVAVERAHRDGSAIVADPAGDVVATTTVVANGHWRVERIVRVDEGDSVIPLDANLIDIHVSGRRVDIAVPGHTLSRTIAGASREDDGSLSLRIEGAGHGDTRVTAKIEGDRMLLTVHDGRLRGRAELVRR
jgi:DNA-directed RNA polymerase specialized sigma24 family protein